MNNPTPQNKEEESEAAVFQVVLTYSLGILLVPVITFISLQYSFDGLGFESTASNVWAAIIAVIALHVMLGLFVYRIFYPPTKQIKKD